LCAWAAAVNARDQAQFAAIALIALPAGALVAALRTWPDLVDGSSRAIYVAVLVALIAIGAALLLSLRRQGAPARP
ncbi:MAG: hypothetical protein ACRDKH_03135, partial [Solirubrobacterales bacterium]